ncbi:serine/threonine-protein kinase [Nonomuraea indica]|uniref:non-specific serine/threonine protein kinase n=1 Tax=Nonomuraea indica TaxID=1581193 RepID=A0ABW8AF46_9ACTN
MLAPGTTLNDRYALTSRVGGGGMGEVWRADDTVLGRTVAVKVMTPALAEDPSFAQRFQNEARAMATLRHPGVVDVYDYGVCEVAGRRVSFLVMEFVEGESLDRVLRRGPLGPAATMRLVAEVADALSAAHEQGIVHRDVKPANLLIRSDGRVALTDFGIAHSASAGHLTATGAMLCSAGYCAPELASASEVTPSVDVYALGVVAFECLAGHLPFQGETPVQIIFKHLHADVPPLPAEVPAGPRAVVAGALEKEPARRWPSAVALAAAARQALAAPDVAPLLPGAAPGVVPGAASGVVPPSGTPASATPSSVTPPGSPAAPPAGTSAARATAPAGAPGGPASPAATEPGTLPSPHPAGPDPHATAPGGARRRARSALLAVAAAVTVTVAVAGSIWLRPESSADPVQPVTPPVTTSVAAPATGAPVTTARQSAPPPRAATTVPRPSVTASTTPTVTATPTPTPSATTSEPTATPTQSPTKEPEPTEEPTTPGPQEPTADPEPTKSADPGEIQCIRAPCP